VLASTNGSDFEYKTYRPRSLFDSTCNCSSTVTLMAPLAHTLASYPGPE